jgi:hypothetical protein
LVVVQDTMPQIIKSCQVARQPGCLVALQGQERAELPNLAAAPLLQDEAAHEGT